MAIHSQYAILSARICVIGGGFNTVLEHNERREEQKWRQRFKVKWLKDGDRNSRYFHILANLRRKYNRIGEIHIGDMRLDGPIQIKEGVFGYFKNHFQSHSSLFSEMPNLDFNPIFVSDMVDLERKFSAEEIGRLYAIAKITKPLGLMVLI
ncbi:hypothetical protein Ddye_001349 [Dipteronia dyeriana]|uniref:Uncharacterized protein n=1 Tax=Dipteronia dyeriana TaxID=168575 RepID=A0AAD9XNR7_9ROSI|nr:hypothetical protein Ddye_001349 [Dipteronia dyeriana]